MLDAQDSPPVGLRRLDHKRYLSGQREQVLAAGHENAGPSAVRQIEKRLMLLVTAAGRASLGWMDGFTVGKIIALLLSSLPGKERTTRC